jgi:hypothetical protein
MSAEHRTRPRSKVADLESVLGATPQEFESLILRHADQVNVVGARPSALAMLRASLSSRPHSSPAQALTSINSGFFQAQRPDCRRRRLKPVAEAEVGEHVRDVRLDGGLGQEGLLPDLGAGQAVAIALSTALSRSVRARMACGSRGPSAGSRTYSATTLRVTDGRIASCAPRRRRTAPGDDGARRVRIPRLDRHRRTHRDIQASGRVSGSGGCCV